MDEIKEGDRVNVYFDSVPWLKNMKVRHIPVATGDCWHLEQFDSGQTFYVMLFSYMEKIQ